jgi:hypothetical protein
MVMKTGKIVGFRGTWDSGIAFLLIEDTNEYVNHIPCDNSPTVRALNCMFPDFITYNHEVDVKAIIGQYIRYETDNMNILSGIDYAD